MRIRTLLSAATAVLAGALAMAPPALAADRDPAELLALTPHDSAQNGTPYDVKPGETVPVQAGVANDGNGISGLVVHLWFIGSEQRLTDNFSNCGYYLDGTEQGAWCEFDQALASRTSYSLPPLHVSVPAGATEAKSLVHMVYSKEFVDSRGGVAKMAGSAKLTSGTGAKASLVEGTDLKPDKQRTAVSFIYFHLILPSSSPSPAHSPTATPTPKTTVKATPAPGGQGGGTGGGLAVTGSNTAVVAGAGAALLIGGAVAFLLTRRRRAKFTA